MFLSEAGSPVVHDSETYEVLTNPDNCLTKWEESYGGKVPKYAIPSEIGKDEEFVGRGIVAGFAMAGAVVVRESGLLVAYEGKTF